MGLSVGAGILCLVHSIPTVRQTRVRVNIIVAKLGGLKAALQVAQWYPVQV